MFKNPDALKFKLKSSKYTRLMICLFAGLPDFLEYLADAHGNLPVKHSIIGHARALETTTMHVSTDLILSIFRVSFSKHSFGIKSASGKFIRI